MTRAERTTPRPGPLHTDGRWIKDRLGRTVILRGPNVSGRHKQPPHLLEPADLEPLARWGFNAMRLVLVWEALEPTPGRVDHEYLDRVAALCARAGELGLHVIIDLHQDIYGRTFGGSGAPDWTVATRDWQDPPPPHGAWFLRYMTSPGVRRSLDRFWRDEDGIQGHFIAAMTEAARRLAGHTEVIGWEPYNEPFPGNLDMAAFELRHLQPFYQRCAESVRRVAPHWLLFFEGTLMTSERRLLLDPGTLGEAVYFPHFYVKQAQLARAYHGDRRELDAVLPVFERDAGERDIPWMLGEYGVPNEAPGGFDYLRDHQRALERLMVGGTFWHYNPTGQDWNFEHMSVALPDRDAPTLAAVVHPYPMAVAGEIASFGYDEQARRFELVYRADEEEAPTVICLPRRCYPDGVSVTVEGGEHSLARGDDLLAVEAPEGATVKVLVEPGA